MLTLAKKVISFLEDASVPFFYYAATFAFMVNIRFALEFVAYGCPLEFKQYRHYLLWYACVCLTSILILAWATKESVRKVSRLVLAAFTLVLAGPLIDMCVYPGSRHASTYFIPGCHDDLLRRFFAFFGSATQSGGLTIGVKAVLVAVFAASSLYVYTKTRNALRSLVAALGLYCAAFFYSSAEMVLNSFLGMCGVRFFATDFYLLNFFFVTLALIQVCGVAYMDNPAFFTSLLRTDRLPCLLHYEFMFILGVALGLSQTPPSMQWYAASSYLPNIAVLVFSLPVIALGIALASIFPGIVAYIEEAAPESSGPSAGTGHAMRAYWQAAWAACLLALGFALVVDCATAVFMGIFLGMYFFYFFPPLRLRRIPFLSKIAVGFNSLVVLALGLRIPAGRVGPLSPAVILICLAGITAAANFVDLKNYKKDMRAGIKTLPVLFGLKDAKLLISIFFTLNYLALICFFKTPFMWAAILLCAFLQWYFLNRKNYQERYVFYVHLFSLAGLIFYLLYQTNFYNS